MNDLHIPDARVASMSSARSMCVPEWTEAAQLSFKLLACDLDVPIFLASITWL